MRGRVPRIGLTTYREPAAWGVWHEVADLLPSSYAQGIRAAGAVALLLPADAASRAAAVLDGLDGLLLSGGPDVEPARYGAVASPATGKPRQERDEWELALAHAALDADLPLLAVCRGMQVLNVALGGELCQHLPDVLGGADPLTSTVHCPTVGVHGRHPVRLAGGSLVAGIVDSPTEVATYHHQSVTRLGDGVVASGWADDGVIEAIEVPSRRWTLGVQWHPEAFGGAPLFDAFVTACRVGVPA